MATDGSPVHYKTAALAERLTVYADLRDGGSDSWDAAREMDVSSDTGRRYERWYAQQRNLPPAAQGSRAGALVLDADNAERVLAKDPEPNTSEQEHETALLLAGGAKTAAELREWLEMTGLSGYEPGKGRYHYGSPRHQRARAPAAPATEEAAGAAGTKRGDAA